MTAAIDPIPEFPGSLKALHAWCVWRYEERDGKTTKVPYRPQPRSDGNYELAPASHSDPSTWVTFEEASKSTEGQVEFRLGVFNDGSHAFIDLDNCIVDGKIQTWALRVLERLNTYAEVTPSGNGLHIIGKGAIDRPGKKKDGCELYCRQRFFTVTGQHVADSPTTVNDISPAVLERLWQDIDQQQLRKTGCIIERYDQQKYQDIVDGDYEKHGYGRSEAVAAALCMLASKHNCDAEKMREEFEATDLCTDWGDKWDRLGDKEIAGAIKVVQSRAKPVVLPEVGFQLTGPRVDGTSFDFVVNPLAGQNDGWFPRGDISLVAAMSGGGKTTLTVDLLEKQSKGEPVFGHTTNKLQYLVIMEDRGARSLERTLKRMHIDQQNFPYVRLSGGLAAGVQRALLAQPTMPAVVFLEGIDLLNDSSDGRNVSADLKQLQQVAEHYHVAIIGSTGSPKQKAKDRYVGLRDQIIGSTVWGRKTETIVVLQKEYGKETDDVTIMTVLPRQDRPEVFNLVWDRGRFRALTAEEIQVGQDKKAVDDLLAWVLQRETFTRPQAAKAFPRMSGKTLSERLDGLVKCQAIRRHTKDAKTFYSVPTAETAEEVQDFGF